MIVKTLRDDFALVFLGAQVSADFAKQREGHPPGDISGMLAQAYKAADVCLLMREKFTPEALTSPLLVAQQSLPRPS